MSGGGWGSVNLMEWRGRQGAIKFLRCPAISRGLTAASPSGPQARVTSVVQRSNSCHLDPGPHPRLPLKQTHWQQNRNVPALEGESINSMNQEID